MYYISFISEFIVLLVHTEVIAVLSTLNNCCLPSLETLCFILPDDASITAKENQMIKMLLKNNYFPVLKRISVMSIVLSCRTWLLEVNDIDSMNIPLHIKQEQKLVITGIDNTLQNNNVLEYLSFYSIVALYYNSI